MTMNLSLTKILLVTIVVIVSVTIGNIATLIKVQFDENKTNSNPRNEEQGNPSSNNKHKISNSYDDLVWFLQISDLHISIFRDVDRLTDLEEFCDITLSTIKPLVVLASGDLTDAKKVDTLGSRQYEDEWILYRNALDKFNVTKKTVWLDVRGNHDNFNIYGPTDKDNFYRNYSIQGGKNPRSYLHTIQKPNGKVYSFIALDACLEPGPKRPFNFFGILNQQETDHVKSLTKKAQESFTSHTVWFGHYPTSCILSAGQGVRSLIASDPVAQAYLCGHFHTMGGMVPEMYTLQQAGFLELELADWKDNRRYRLAAIDHGLFSFIDVRHREWPVVLVTNPKHALSHIPNREPRKSMMSSTHIRVLAFSPSRITSVKVKIDSEDWSLCTHIKGPLFVKLWEPKLYIHGLHEIKVEVADEAGRVTIVDQPFSLDGTSPGYKVAPRILLMANMSIGFQVLFGISILGCVVPLCVMRLMLCRLRAGLKTVPTSNITLINSWYRRLFIVANLDSFYYPLILYPLYICIGPWSIGEIIDNHIGVIFAWGIFVHGAYLPGSFTYGYGYFQMLTWQFPLIAVIAYKLDSRLNLADPPSKTKFHRLLSFWNTDVNLFIITFLQVLFLFFFWLSYGSLAIIFGPFRSWPIFTTLCLWTRARKIPQHSIQELADIFQEANFGSPRLKPSHGI